MTWESLDAQVNILARRYGHTYEDIEDLAQIARIEMWITHEKKPDCTAGYLCKVAENTMRDHNRMLYRKKRNPEKGLVSLQQPLPDGRIMEEVIGTPALPFKEVETQETFIAILRRIYGKQFVRRIARERHRGINTRHKLLRVLFEDVEGIPFERLSSEINVDFFRERGLYWFLQAFYKGSPYRAVASAYPGKIVPWEWHQVPLGFWQGRDGHQHAADALEWFAKRRNLHSANDCGTITRIDFVDEGLGGMLQARFNDSPTPALSMLFPEFKPWKAKCTIRGFYSSESNRRLAVLDFLQSHDLPDFVHLDAEEAYSRGIRNAVSSDALIAFGLAGLVSGYYDHRIYFMFKTLFPEQILPWSIKSTEAWRDNPRETGITAVQWLFGNYLRIPIEEIPRYATQRLFRTVGFGGIMSNDNVGFRDSPYMAVNASYPGQFTPADFSRGRKVVHITSPAPKQNH